VAWWEALLDSLGVVTALIALGFVFLFLRRRWIGRTGGSFECSVRFTPPSRNEGAAAARGWTLGLARYVDDNIEWFRVFSFSPRPRHVFSREMTVLSRRTPGGAEAFSLYAGHNVIELRLGTGRVVELAMSEAAMTAFLAWTEAGPPGHMRLLA
jgi:hypothetical protein